MIYIINGFDDFWDLLFIFIVLEMFLLINIKYFYSLMICMLNGILCMILLFNEIFVVIYLYGKYIVYFDFEIKNIIE